MLAQFYPPFLEGEERYTQDISCQMAAQDHVVVVAPLDVPECKMIRESLVDSRYQTKA
jgi:hypothetical protein